MSNVREILNEFSNGFEAMAQSNGKFVSAFSALQDTVLGDEVLPQKVKELISVAISVYARCKYCIVYHVYCAYQAGATREEILSAASHSIAGFGAGPSMAYSATILLDAVNEFEGDFQK